MGQIANPVTIERGLRAEFSKALGVKPNAILESLWMVVNSTTRDEKYGWLGEAPQLVEWKDVKKPKGLFDKSYTLVNVPYEGTIKVDKFDLRDDQVGAAFLRTRDLTIRGRMFPTKLLMDAKIANGLAYDGQAFFATTHSEGSSGTQSNLLTGTGTSLTQLQDDFFTAWNTMLSYKDDQGEPIRETDADMKPVVVCPPGIFGKFQQLQNAAIISNTENTIKGLFDLVASPRLVDTNDWYFYDVGGMLKPYILQVRDALEFRALEETSDSGFLSRFYHYSVEWRGAVGYGLWQKAIKTTNV